MKNLLAAYESARANVTCRTCDAKPSEPCRNRNRAMLGYTHGTRLRDDHARQEQKPAKEKP